MNLACRFVTAFVCLAAANASLAATQGEPGRESTASNRITLIIHPSLQITAVDDITINVNRRDRDALHTEEVCVRGNSGAAYSVVAHTNPGADPEFLLRSATDDNLAFEVRYRSDLSKTTGEILRPNVHSRLQPSPTASAACNGGSAAAFDLKFPAKQLSRVEPGVYTGLLTLTVVAE